MRRNRKTGKKEKKIVAGQRKARGEKETQRSTSTTPVGAPTVTLTFGHRECAAHRLHCPYNCKNQHAAKGAEVHP